MLRFMNTLISACGTVLLISACSPKIYSAEELAQFPPAVTAATMVKQPQVNDIYVADVSKFSNYFGDTPTYALMRVIEVNPEFILVITESQAYPGDFNGSVNDLGGEFNNITWDNTEKIKVQISNLENHFKNGDIIATRRLTTKEINNFLK